MPKFIALRILLFIALLGVILFGCAGRVDLPFFWAYLGIFVICTVVVLRGIDPELMRERVRPAPGGRDRYIRALVMPFFVAHLVVAGLDVGRYGWSRVPWPAQLFGLAVLAGAMALNIWAIRTNRFFSPVVRIQTERGHHVITQGPYRYIRHPGYLGAIVMMLASGVALGSWWSLLPMIGGMAVIVRRTVIEDRFVRENLEGYAAYAQRVPYRLVPWVW